MTLVLPILVKKAVKACLLAPLIASITLSRGYCRLIAFFVPQFKAVWKDFFQGVLNDQRQTVLHRRGGKEASLVFYTPNYLCQLRADTFSTKEPETLEWLDHYGNGGVLYDVGANIGLYSIYYAKTQNASVFAFEPSVFNLKQLVKNINANDVQRLVKVIVNPLSSRNGFADFNLQTLDEGGALSAFGVGYGQDGRDIRRLISYATYGLALDSMVQSSAIPEKPALIKIDVDGIEHLILEGAVKTLSDPACRSVLVEVMDSFLMQAEKVSALLTSCGFTLSIKHSGVTDGSGDAPKTFNQIWVKN